MIKGKGVIANVDVSTDVAKITSTPMTALTFGLAISVSVNLLVGWLLE